VSDHSSPCGIWRLTVRRLGPRSGPTTQFGVFVRIEADGTAWVLSRGSTAEPGFGGWRSAGPGRVVLVTESFVTGPGGSDRGRLAVQAAAELIGDGRTCQVRLQWQRIDVNSRPMGVPVRAEAEGSRLAP
jgi:hypothetical protein